MICKLTKRITLWTICANINTLYKKVLNQVVITSEVKQLYKAVLSQINTQKKIKETQYQDKKKKNKLIADIFLAVFSASALYKTVWDFVKEEFSWLNWGICGDDGGSGRDYYFQL